MNDWLWVRYLPLALVITIGSYPGLCFWKRSVKNRLTFGHSARRFTAVVELSYRGSRAASI